MLVVQAGYSEWEMLVLGRLCWWDLLTQVGWAQLHSSLKPADSGHGTLFTLQLVLGGGSHWAVITSDSDFWYTRTQVTNSNKIHQCWTSPLPCDTHLNDSVDSVVEEDSKNIVDEWSEELWVARGDSSRSRLEIVAHTEEKLGLNMKTWSSTLYIVTNLGLLICHCL